MKRLPIALLVLFVAVLPVTGSSLSLTATAEPESALPGIPIHILLTVQNLSNMPQTLPKFMVLQVRPPATELFIPDDLGPLQVQHLPEEYLDDSARTLKPREKRIFDIPLSVAVTDGAMADSRLWAPGEYGLRLFFHEELTNSKVERFGIHGLLGAGRISSPLLASSEAILRVEKPAGVDAEIWTIVLQRTKGRGLRATEEANANAVANEIWKRSEDSSYLPYVLTYMRGTPRAQLEKMWSHVLERFPDHPIAEGIRLGNAQRKAGAAGSAIYGNGELDLETILRLTEEARAEMEAIAKDAQHDLVRIRARKALANLRTREQVIDEYRSTPRGR